MENSQFSTLNSPLISDGAMGTMLLAAGLRIDEIPDAAWHHDRIVRNIHRQYIDAGADIITTCTFTLPSLAPARRDTIRAAVDAAREAGAPRIAASVGPAQAATRTDILRYYAEVIETFLDCGLPDFFLAETVMSAAHARVIHEIIRSNCRDLPLVVSAAVNAAGTMLSGEAVSDLYAMFSSDPATIPGLNCFTLPAPLPIPSATGFLAPSAGLPGNIIPPRRWAAALLRAATPSARILGGCCGTTPSHIAALKNVVMDTVGS